MSFICSQNQFKFLFYIQILCATSILLLQECNAKQPITVSDYANKQHNQWREKVFGKKIKYEIQHNSGRTIIKASSVGSASGLYRDLSIDLKKTPCLTWTWKIEKLLNTFNERIKEGDDYSARIYVIFEDEVFFWKTKSLNYVWSSNQPIGSSWPNAYSDKVTNVAVQNDTGKVGQWITQKRNVFDDYMRLIDKNVPNPTAIAIMTDTDDSNQSATTYYGPMHFSAQC